MIAIAQKLKTTIIISFAILAGFSKGAGASKNIADAAAAISETEMRKTIDDLAAFGTRNARTTKALEAADYLKSRLEELGLRVSEDVFTSHGIEMRNVIGVRPAGRADSRKVLILGAHYDSINGEGDEAPAPGADDNASGVAAILAAARAMRDIPIGAEVRFVFFTGEEIGLLGSRHYVKKWKQSNESASGTAAIIVDYIGTDMGGPDGVMFLYNRPSEPLMKTLKSAVETGNIALHTWPLRSEMFRSFGDYKPFWEAGIPAVMLVREYRSSGKEEGYHTRNDLPERLRFGQIVSISKLICRAVAAWGN